MTEYKRIPLSVFDIRINSRGETKSFTEGVPDPSRTIDGRGYQLFYVRLTDGRRKCYSVHRMVGLLFIEIPERLKDFDISSLQINHKDGNKNNNYKSNLEWVTLSENVAHANENELYLSRIPVLVKSDEDGLITRFRSIKLAADVHGVSHEDIREHILRSYAGVVSVNGFRFKADNGKDWSDKKIHPSSKIGLRRSYRVTGFDNKTKEEWLFLSLPEACFSLGISLNEVKYHNTKFGTYKTNDGQWEFIIANNTSIRPVKVPVVTLNRVTGQIKKYSSVLNACKDTGISGMMLKDNINGLLAGMIPWNGVYFKKDDGKDFPIVEYLFPDKNHMGREIRHVVFKIGNNTPFLAARISDICKEYKWDDSCYYDHRKKNGMGQNFRGLIIHDIDDIDLGNRRLV